MSALSSKEGAEAIAFTQCMRSHGVPAFPAPTTVGNGRITFPRGDLKVSRSRLDEAEKDCQHLIPGGDLPPQAEALTDELRFARCMRSHGVPTWPHPTNMGAEFEFNLRAAGIDPASPQDKPAEQECESQLRLSNFQLQLPVAGGPGGHPATAGGS